MCGRFVQFWFDEVILDHLGVTAPSDSFKPSYNVAPTQKAWVVTEQETRSLEPFHWGLVPSWSRDTKMGARLINARSESAAEKPSFRAAFKKRRCLVLSNGFYEWTGPKGDKQPHLCTTSPGGMMAFAGLWETWQIKAPDESPDSALPYHSFTILTRAASLIFEKIHDRMPVILDPKAFDSWLDPKNQDPALLKELLEEHHLGKIVTHPVSRKVNSPRYNAPDSIEPLESRCDQPPTQETLF